MYVIYLDVLFMINFVMDFLIFLTVTLILNKWIALWRHFAAAVMAALLYCLLVILPVLQSVPYSVYSLWIPIMPILFLYKPHSFKVFGKYLLVSIGVAAVYGGVIFNLWYMLGGGYQKIQMMHLSILFGISIGIAVLFYLSFYWIRRCCIFKHFTYRIKFYRGQREIEVLGLLDTGNLLYTPLDHKPVIVLTYNAAKELLSVQECSAIEQFYCSCEKEMESIVTSSIGGPEILIPFSSVGCKNGFLWGMKLEMRMVLSDGEKVMRHCIVGISKEHINSDRQYEALLHPEYILEGERVG